MGRGFLGPRGMTAIRDPLVTWHAGWSLAGEENEPAVAGGRLSHAIRGVLRSDLPHRDRNGRALRKGVRMEEW